LRFRTFSRLPPGESSVDGQQAGLGQLESSTATLSSFGLIALAGGTQYGLRCAGMCKTDMLPGATKPVSSLRRGTEMSLSFYTAVDEIRDAATENRLPGPRKKPPWATILRQVASSDMCDGFLAGLIVDIIRDYLKRPSDEETISMWLETDTGSGDDPEGLLADCVRIDPETELLAEATRVAWDEARRRTQRKKKR
jgi:hypothetical protein